LDLDDEEDLLGGLDIKDLPSLAVYRDKAWVFWGSVEPNWPLIQKTCVMASTSLERGIEIELSRLLGAKA
jgi:hypothetical protein